MAGGGGCTKKSTHRLLPPNWKFELHSTFPKIPHFQVTRISDRIKNSRNDGTSTARGQQHPCYKTHLKFIKCHFRYPVNYESECQTLAQHHKRCLARFDDWKPDTSFSYMSFLERFDLAQATPRYSKELPKLKEQGSTFDLQFK